MSEPPAIRAVPRLAAAHAGPAGASAPSEEEGQASSRPDRADLSWYERHFDTPAQERRFTSSVAFGVTFALTRTVTHAIRDQRGPFRNVEVGGRHIHHLTFGILGLLGVGYAWLNGAGMPTVAQRQTGASRATAAAYGAGAALTLDEFALWLNLADDYWSSQGRESIDAVVLFGAFLSAGASARNHLADIARRALTARGRSAGPPQQAR